MMEWKCDGTELGPETGNRTRSRRGTGSRRKNKVRWSSPDTLGFATPSMAFSISVHNKWWVPAVAHQAVPTLCILKKSGKLCTVFNL